MIFPIVCVLVFLLVSRVEGVVAQQIYARLSNINEKVTFEDTKKALSSGNAYSRQITAEEYRKMSTFKWIRLVTVVLFLFSLFLV